MIHTVKGFTIVNEGEVDVFLELPGLFYDSTTFGNLISGSFAFSKSSFYIWKFSFHVLLKPSLKDFEHYLFSMWNECSCAVVWTFFATAFLWDWNENWPFPVLNLRGFILYLIKIMKTYELDITKCLYNLEKTFETFEWFSILVLKKTCFRVNYELCISLTILNRYLNNDKVKWGDLLDKELKASVRFCSLFCDLGPFT